MGLLSDSVFDAALSYIKTNCNQAEVRASASSVLIDSITLDSGNFGSPVNNSGSGLGRKIQCLVSSASDMKTISVSSAGSAQKVALLNSSASSQTDHAIASIASAPVSLGASDQVNLSTFSVILKDPS